MSKGWENIKPDDIIKAIQEFEKNPGSYPKARNTFLFYNGKHYTAKQIRWLAYKIANGKEISKEEFSGGLETVKFFNNLGFSVEYKGELITPETKIKHTDNQTTYKIGRLILTRDFYDDENLLNIFVFLDVLTYLLSYLDHEKSKIEFLILPGGLIEFEFPEELVNKNIDIDNIQPEDLQLILKEAEEYIIGLFDFLDSADKNLLKQKIDFITLGIDGFNNVGQSIELVAVFDPKRFKVIHWTGKFYPTEQQKRYLIKFPDLHSHFIELKGQRVMILGCHDLKVFDPRGQANAKPNSWKKITANKFKEISKKFKPEIVLHHPHTTDSPRIWLTAWRNLEKVLPSVEFYASAIRYINWEGKERGSLEDVLYYTAFGDVFDFILPDNLMQEIKNEMTGLWEEFKNS